MAKRKGMSNCDETVTVLFGQQLPQPALAAALEFARSCDLFLVIGSSLRVMPAARLPCVAYERGIPLLIVNIESTPLDQHADVVLRAPAGPTLTRIVAGIAALDR